MNKSTSKLVDAADEAMKLLQAAAEILEECSRLAYDHNNSDGAAREALDDASFAAVTLKSKVAEIAKAHLAFAGKSERDRTSSDPMAVAAVSACREINAEAPRVDWEFQVDGSRVGTSGKAWHQGSTAWAWDNDQSPRAPIKAVRFIALPFGSRQQPVSGDCFTVAGVQAAAGAIR